MDGWMDGRESPVKERTKDLVIVLNHGNIMTCTLLVPVITAPFISRPYAASYS